jgi:hypothetical protein
MLQGSPFETQLVVDDRTRAVRNGVAQQRRYRASRVQVKSREWPETFKPVFDVRNLSVNPLEIVKRGWWLPAGIALSILLSQIIGR